MDDFYWNRHPGGPYATLIKIATTYLHPEAYDLESLRWLAEHDDHPEMRLFKDELRQAITCPGQVPRDELSSHVEYDDDSPETFLRRLWRDLYGDEPVETTGSPPGDTAGRPARSAETTATAAQAGARDARTGTCHRD